MTAAKSDELEADYRRSYSTCRVRNRCPRRNDLGMFELVLVTNSVPLPARVLLEFAAGSPAHDRRSSPDLEDQTAPEAGTDFG
jgi:hypothetical protein